MKQYKRIKCYGKNPNEIFIKDIKNDYYITNEEEVVNLLNKYVEEIDDMNDHLKFILENIPINILFGLLGKMLDNDRYFSKE